MKSSRRSPSCRGVASPSSRDILGTVMPLHSSRKQLGLFPKIRATRSDEPGTRRSLRVAGLFAGVGGLEAGLARAGHETTLLCEIDEGARAVLEARYPDTPKASDVCARSASSLIALAARSIDSAERIDDGLESTRRVRLCVRACVRLFSRAPNPNRWQCFADAVWPADATDMAHC